MNLIVVFHACKNDYFNVVNKIAEGFAITCYLCTRNQINTKMHSRICYYVLLYVENDAIYLPEYKNVLLNYHYL